MKTCVCCIFGLLLLTIPAWPQKGTATTEKAVAALEQQWLKAQQTSNPDLLEPLLADRFIETTSDGKMMGKAGALAGTKAAKYESAQYTDVKVSVFGNTAIATGVQRQRNGREGQTHSLARAVDRHVGQVADRQMAVRCQPRLAGENVDRSG
jgi:hypothetical protein